MNKETFIRIAKSVCAGTPEEEAYYTISDAVDLWDNNHKQEALEVLAYAMNLKKTMESYREIKVICGDYVWAEKTILPKVAKYIVSFIKRKQDFAKGLQRWNAEYGKCFINDLM